MSFKLKYDSRKVDRSKDSGSFEPPKNGTYKMKIVEVTHEEDKERLVFVLRQQEADAKGNGMNYGYWDYVPVGLDWKLDQYLQAVGIDTEAKATGVVTEKTFLNKIVMGRTKLDTEYDPDNPRAKLARVFPYIEDDEAADDDEDFDEDVEVDGEEDEDEPDDDFEEEDGDDGDGDDELDILALGADAEDGDEDAQNKLIEIGSENDIEEPDYDTWTAFAKAIDNALNPPKKPAAAKKGGAAKKAAPPPAEDEDDSDYDTWDTPRLKAELAERELPTTGSKSAMVARLRAHDEDPFG